MEVVWTKERERIQCKNKAAKENQDRCTEEKQIEIQERKGKLKNKHIINLR